MDFVFNYLIQGIIQILVILHLVTLSKNNPTIERKGFEGGPCRNYLVFPIMKSTIGFSSNFLLKDKK